MKIKIYGHSDDCIEIDGDLREEFYPSGNGPNYISCSDGSLLTIEYAPDDTACWRINLVVAGTAAYTHVMGDEDAKGKQNEGGGYSDVATLEGVDLKWIAITDKNPSEYWMEDPATVIRSYNIKWEHPWDAIVWKNENGKVITHRTGD